MAIATFVLWLMPVFSATASATSASDPSFADQSFAVLLSLQITNRSLAQFD